MWNLFEEASIVFDGKVKRYLPCPVWKRGRPWEIDSTVADMCIKNAREYLDWQPRVITASDFMLFFETGDRIIFEGEHFKRRSALGSMMVAECIEAKGRFLKKIIDMAWMICEESYWGLPGTKTYGEILPDKYRPDLELFACETGSLLSYLLYIMGDAFGEVSPIIRMRIEREIRERIIIPFLERDDFTWMGLGGQTGELWKLSNWTPWCYSNCLLTLLLVETNEENQIAGIKKVMKGLGRFLAGYRSDGGCDEGCGYWSRAAGSVFDCLEMMYQVSGGKIDLFPLPIIKNMGEYIVDCYVGDGYFVNFADAGARVIPEAELVYRYGKRIKSEAMCALGKDFIDTYLKERYYVISQSPMRLLPALFNYRRIKDEPVNTSFGSQKYYDITQVCMVRTPDRWFFAAKGGHNDESHNHNDVGSFVLYYDSNPIFIDAGCEKYSGKTFSEHRYEIWTMKSDYHNLPKINGISQKDGENYHADNCVWDNNKFSCEIQNAYPVKARVKLWKREILKENDFIMIRENAEFIGESSYEIMFMTPIKPELQEGRVKLGEFEMLFDTGVLKADYETIELNDDGLRRVWGILYRLYFSNIKKTNALQLVFKIKIMIISKNP